MNKKLTMRIDLLKSDRISLCSELNTGRFSGYYRLDLLDVYEHKADIKIKAYNKITKKVEGVSLIKGGCFFNENGMDISDAILKKKLYIPVLEIKNANYSPCEHYDVISGDLFYVRSQQKNEEVGIVCRYDFFKESPKAIIGKKKFFMGRKIKNRYEFLEFNKKNVAILDLLKNLHDQTHIIIHKNDKNNIFNIKYYRIFYDKLEKSVNIKLVLINDSNKSHYIFIKNEEISGNQIIGLDSKISSAQIECYRPQCQLPELSPAKLLIEYGLHKYISSLIVEGMNNRISLKLDESGGFVYDHDFGLNNNIFGEIKSVAIPNRSSSWKINNSIFNICFELQKNGIAKKFYSEQTRLAKKIGVSYIEMTCSMSIGGYAWAKEGFKFKDPTTSIFFRRLFVEEIKKMSLDDWLLFDKDIDESFFKKIKDEILEELARPGLDRLGEEIKNTFYYDSADPIEFANFKKTYLNRRNEIIEVKRRKNKYKKDKIDPTLYSIGKSIMLGTTWDGIKYI